MLISAKTSLKDNSYGKPEKVIYDDNAVLPRFQWSTITKEIEISFKESKLELL